jgi:hypothetical protein
MRALANLEARGAAGFSSPGAAFAFALDELTRPGSARPGVHRHLLFAAQGSDGASFGAAAVSDERLQAVYEAIGKLARDQAVSLHLFSLTGLAEQTPDFVARLIGESGSFSRVLRAALNTSFFQRVQLPRVDEVRLANLSIAPDLYDAQLVHGGRFHLGLSAVSGPNRMLAVARLSDGRRVEREWTLEFDDSLIRETLRAEEAERIRRLRERQVEIQPEPEQ